MPVDLARGYAHLPGISWATYPNLFYHMIWGRGGGGGAIMMDNKLGDKITIMAFSLK